MNSMVGNEWKLVVAIGGVAAVIILVAKMDPTDAKEVSIHAIDAFKSYAVAIEGKA